MKSFISWIKIKLLRRSIDKKVKGIVENQRPLRKEEKEILHRHFWELMVDETEKKSEVSVKDKSDKVFNPEVLSDGTLKEDISNCPECGKGHKKGDLIAWNVVPKELQELYTPPPIQKPIEYGTAVAFVEPGFYATWMESIRSQLPSDVKIGQDIMAYVTFGNSRGQQKVTWKAKTERGNEYLISMMDTLSRPELSEQKKLENK